MIETIQAETGTERRDRGKPQVEHAGSLAVLFLILALAAVLRLFRLSSIPGAFDVDEASVGYDAYCLLRTARDQYGSFLPLFARGFDVYDEAFHRYLIVPSVWFFGLNEFATRLPSALVGLANVAVMYPLARQLSDRRTALLAAFFLAVSPWHIQESRIGLREILMPFTLTVGLYYFLRGVQERRGLILGGLALALTLWTYSAARVFVPAFVVGLAIIYRRELREIPRQTIVAAVLFTSVLGALALFWISPAGMIRANQVLEPDSGRVLYNYLTYFDPRYLFRDGINHPLHSPPYLVGNLQVVEMLTAAAGIAATWWLKPQTAQLLWLWLILYPLPAFLTDDRQAVRSIGAAPLFALLSAFGAAALLAVFRGRMQTIARAALVFATTASVALYLKLFFVDYAHLSSDWWDYGVGQAIRSAEASGSPAIYVSDRFFMPHIFVLFYTAYPPAAYQAAPIAAQSERGWGWSYAGERVGRYEIARVRERRELTGEALFVIRADEFDEFKELGYKWRSIETIRDPGGVDRIHVVSAQSAGAP